MLAGFIAETARAAPISYVFAAGTTTDLAAGPETITGSFTFDASTNTETNVTITLTGISIFFAMPLDVSPDPLMEVRLGNVKLAAADSDPDGAAIFAPAIPEPASLALLSAALGIFLLTA